MTLKQKVSYSKKMLKLNNEDLLNEFEKRAIQYGGVPFGEGQDLTEALDMIKRIILQRIVKA
jgi:hypothetical protein